MPADIVFLRTSEKSGACFIRTDQLDGETDWKLKLAVESTQALESDLVILKKGLFHRSTNSISLVISTSSLTVFIMVHSK